MNSLHLSDISFKKERIPPWYEKDFATRVLVEGIPVGYAGKLSRDLVNKFEIEEKDVFVFELDVESLQSAIPDKIVYKPMPRFPAVFRDISIVIHKGIESERVRRVIEKTGGELVEAVALYDLYEGKGLAPDEKALTFRIRFRSKERTLDGKEVNQLNERIIEAINKELGGRLREG